MKIGLHLAAYQCQEFVDKFFQPWIEYKNHGGDLEVSVGHVCFKENFENGATICSTDGTELAILEKMPILEGKLQVLAQPMSEVEARNIILEPLRNVDYVWIAAPDEIYTFDEIKRTVAYLDKESFIQTFHIEFKNLVFSEQQYVKGFCPTRIFKNTGPKVHRFFEDDEVNYVDECGVINSYRNLSVKRIPIHVCNPLHYTWLNNERSKQKVRYQERRWNPPKGYGCSFTWDDEQGLVWNTDYFQRTGQPIPIVYNV